MSTPSWSNVFFDYSSYALRRWALDDPARTLYTPLPIIPMNVGKRLVNLVASFREYEVSDIKRKSIAESAEYIYATKEKTNPSANNNDCWLAAQAYINGNTEAINTTQLSPVANSSYSLLELACGAITLNEFLDIVKDISTARARTQEEQK